MKPTSLRFTLLEGLLFLTALSLVLALFAPGLLDSSPSVRINKAHAFAREVLDAAVEHHKKTKRWPSNEEILLPVIAADSGFQSNGVDYKSGSAASQVASVSITMSPENDPAIAGRVISVQAFLQSNSEKTEESYYFVCKASAGVIAGLPIPAKFLPPQCRT